MLSVKVPQKVPSVNGKAYIRIALTGQSLWGVTLTTYLKVNLRTQLTRGWRLPLTTALVLLVCRPSLNPFKIP